MARKVTAVKREAFLAICQKLGLCLVDRKGWTKAYKMGEDGKPTGKAALGIPMTKSVTRIELVNFEHELAVAHPKPPAGSVTQMVNFEQDEKLILGNFYKIAKEGIAQAKAAKKEEREAVAAGEAAQPAEQGEQVAASH